MATGNISNTDMLALFDRHLDQLVTALNQAGFVELGPTFLVIHGVDAQ